MVKLPISILLTFLLLIFSYQSFANNIIGKGVFCTKSSTSDKYKKYVGIHIFDKKRIEVFTLKGNELKEEMHNYELNGLEINFIPNIVERTRFSGILNRKNLSARIMKMDYKCIAKDDEGLDFTLPKLKNYMLNLHQKIQKKD